MISPDLRVERLDPRQMLNAPLLLDPPQGAPTEAEGGAMGLLNRLTATGEGPRPRSSYQSRPVVLLTRGGRPLRALRLGGGEVPVTAFRGADPESVRAYRRAKRVPFVVVVEVARLPEVLAAVQGAVDPREDGVAQALAAISVLRQAVTRGDVVFEPALVGTMPIPRPDTLQAAFDKMLPDGRSLVFYVSDAGRLWLSAILRKRRGDIDLITSHRAVAADAPYRTPRPDARAVLAAVSRRIAPPHIGIFVPLDAWHRFVHGDRSALARSLAAGQAVLDPAPPWLVGIIGAAAISDAANRSARIAGKLLSRAPFGGGRLGRRAEKLMKTVANPLEPLGLDPWELIRWGQAWSHRARAIWPDGGVCA